MFKMSIEVCIEASQELVWANLAKLEDIQIWSAAVLEAHCPLGKEKGIGAERVCFLPGKIVLNEKWTEWREGESFRYVGTGLPLIKSAANRWTLVTEGKRTRLTSYAEVEFKGGIFGRLLEPLFSAIIKKTAPRTFAALKYFIENGKAFDGKETEIPLDGLLC